MGRRSRIKGHYVVRDRHGRFKRWTSVGKSTRADRRKKAKQRPKKSGYGHRGDYKKKSGKYRVRGHLRKVRGRRARIRVRGHLRKK